MIRDSLFLLLLLLLLLLLVVLLLLVKLLLLLLLLFLLLLVVKLLLELLLELFLRMKGDILLLLRKMNRNFLGYWIWVAKEMHIISMIVVVVAANIILKWKGLMWRWKRQRGGSRMGVISGEVSAVAVADAIVGSKIRTMVLKLLLMRLHLELS